MTQMTLTSVGFGDISPQSEDARAFAVVMIVVSYGCFARLVGFALAHRDEKQRVALETKVKTKKFDRRELLAMNTQNDGTIIKPKP